MTSMAHMHNNLRYSSSWSSRKSRLVTMKLQLHKVPLLVLSVARAHRLSTDMITE